MAIIAGRARWSIGARTNTLVEISGALWGLGFGEFLSPVLRPRRSLRQEFLGIGRLQQQQVRQSKHFWGFDAWIFIGKTRIIEDFKDKSMDPERIESRTAASHSEKYAFFVPVKIATASAAVSCLFDVSQELLVSSEWPPFQRIGVVDWCHFWPWVHE